MRKVLLVIGMLIASATTGAAQSNLPECAASQKENYTNCHFVWVSPSKRQYVIEFKDPSRPGFGAGQSADGIKIDGIWKNRLQNGPGSTTHPNGNKFVGEFRDGKYNGQGTYTWANSDSLVGIWKENSITGTKSWKDGRKYTGEFDLNGNPKAFFSYDASGITSVLGGQLSCGARSTKETLFKQIEKELIGIEGLRISTPGLNPNHHRFNAWSLSFFPNLPMTVLYEKGGSNPTPEVRAEMENPFPMLSLVNTRTDRRNDAIKKIECSGELVGNFGPLGTYRNVVQYVVQLTDDGNIYMSLPQR